MNSRRSRAARIGSFVLWYALPALVVVAVGAYIYGATVGQANPPAVPVEGASMRPTLVTGDLVILKGVDPRKLRKGDVIGFRVPTQVRQEFGLPAEMLHRIIKVGHDSLGRFFVTKGDGNATKDGFVTRPDAVIGEMVTKVPGLGYPLLFFRSRQGEIFLAACVLVAISYFLIGVVEERRIYAEETSWTMETLLSDTRELKDVLTTAHTLTAPPPKVDTEELEEEVRAARAQSAETSETMRELVGAVGEYGKHLRSHTAVMQNLAATTAELSRAAAGLGRALPAERSADDLSRDVVRPLGLGQPGTAARVPATAGDFPLGLPSELLARRTALATQSKRIDALLQRLGNDSEGSTPAA